jgi:hypothetical protein
MGEKKDLLEDKIIMTNEQWEKFVNGELVAFCTNKGIEKISVNDGCGKTGSIARTKNGEFKVSVGYTNTI